MAGLLAALGRAWRYLVDPPAASFASPARAFAEDADIAFHVAWREANSRQQQLSPLHLLYGLLQDESFVAAIERAGGDATAIEHRVLEALDGLDPLSGHDEALAVVTRAVQTAISHGRRATCLDLWAHVERSAAASLVEAGAVDRHALLFTAVHGRAEPPVPAAGPVSVDVVLRNDDYSTKEFVVAVLAELFELADDRALATMEAVHHHGYGVVGRYPADAARGKVTAARARAREHGFPLWIAIEG
jgi:ATP-dependent Clp protease adaptor protein ClpS